VAAFGGVPGFRVMPGTYTARLTVGDAASLSESFEVRGDPRIDAANTDFAANQRFLSTIADALVELHSGVNDIRDVRDQVNSVVQQARDAELPGAEALDDAGQVLADSIGVLEEVMFQKRRQTQQDMVAYAGMLDTQLGTLGGEVDGTDLPPNAGAAERLGDLETEWSAARAMLNRVLGDMLDDFNRLARESGVPAIITKSERRTVS